MPSFKYQEAIVVSNLSADNKFLDNEKSSVNDNGVVDIIRCREELTEFHRVLREAGADVIELAPDQSPFVGDLAFALNGIVLLARPKDLWKRKEVQLVRHILRKELQMPIHDIENEDALLEASDILFTGRELFVGISDFTNENGARYVANVFPEYPCSTVKIPNSRRLRDFVNMASKDVICVGGGNEAQCIIKRMECEATFPYHKLTMPEPEACNVLCLNGFLLHLPRIMIPKSNEIFDDRFPNVILKEVTLSEMSKKCINFSRLTILLNSVTGKKPISPHLGF